MENVFDTAVGFKSNIQNQWGELKQSKTCWIIFLKFDDSLDIIKEMKLNDEFLFLILLKDQDDFDDRIHDMSKLVITQEVIPFVPNEDEEDKIENFTLPSESKRDKSNYIKFIGETKVEERRKLYPKGEKNDKGHFKAVLLCHSISKTEIETIWLPGTGEVKSEPTKKKQEGEKQDILWKVAEDIYTFNEKRDALDQGFMTSKLTSWLRLISNDKANSHACIYAAVVFDPVKKCRRVYIGQTSSLAYRWRRVCESDGTNSHIRDISRILRKIPCDYLFCDLVFSCCILNALTTNAKQEKTFQDLTTHQLDFHLFPIEVIPNPTTEILNDREAHWIFILGGFDPVLGLNDSSSYNKYFKLHLKKCRDCFEKIISSNE
jgi:hypothetical protein